VLGRLGRGTEGKVMWELCVDSRLLRGLYIVWKKTVWGNCEILIKNLDAEPEGKTI